MLEQAEDIEVVGTAADGAEAVRLAGALQPDVILMDLAMPTVSGLEAIAQIVSARRDAVVVALSGSLESEQVLRALDAGAVGYLLKDASTATLHDGVRAAADGGSPIDPVVARAVLRARAEQVAAEAAELTPREVQVLQLVADGLLNKRVARALDISEKTVKAHLTKIFQRLGVSDRAHAVEWAVRHNVLVLRSGQGPGEGS